MSKPSKPKNKLSATHIQFIDFWIKVAAELGTSRLNINHKAKSIHDLFHKNSDARPYLVNAIKQSYEQNKCQHLHSPISVDVVLDILGETAFKLSGNQRDDLLDIELLEEIAWCIDNDFFSYLDISHTDDCSDTLNSNDAKVISFSRYKSVKSNR